MGLPYSQELRSHRELDHHRSEWHAFVGEIVYGGIDGIVTTFAVVAWFAGAGAGEGIVQVGWIAVVLFGLANLIGDGVSMGLGKYLATRSEQDIYHREWNNEKNSIQQLPDRERAETIELMKAQGMSDEDAAHFTELLARYPDARVKWQMDNELAMPDVRDENPLIQWLITLWSFVVFWFIPLIPYIISPDASGSWIVSIAVTMGALTILGIVRRYITRMNFMATVFQMVFLGMVAAWCAWIAWRYVSIIRG